MKVIEKEESRVHLDGLETCREYMITPKTVFGSSTPRPGQTGGIDSGHPGGYEVFYVSRGEIPVHNTQTDKFYELHEGGIILVYEGKSYELTDIGTDMAVITQGYVPRTD